jgi:acetyl esterase/lipase
MPTTRAPYGTWPSPLDAHMVAAHDGRPEYLAAVGEEVWWTAPRPDEGGRRALMRLRADGSGHAESVLPAPWNVRNRVIEYGGTPFAGAPRATGGPLVVFTHQADQRMYSLTPDEPGAAPVPLTPLSDVGGGLRWCDMTVLPDRGEVLCVLEEFTGDAPTDVRRVLAAVPLDGSAAEDRAAVRELVAAEHRFVTGPRLSPDGRRAAWLAWDHPSMPWDGTRVMTAHVAADGTFTGVREAAGGPEESVVQVEWAADGSLLAATDRTGWWNLHRIDPDGAAEGVNLCPREEEFGGGMWRIGLVWFAPLPGGLVAAVHGRGAQRLALLDPATGELTDAPGPWTEWYSTLAVAGSRVVGVAAGPRTAHEVVELDTATGHTRILAAGHPDPVDPAYYPQPEARVFTGPDGREVHAHVLAPHHPVYTGADGEKPPYVIWVHGGPTSRSQAVLDVEAAYFTSRGIGVAVVNYGGSTGYGRAYRNRLREAWGVVDVEDCAAVARALADEGAADPDRLAIRGGSAGGWTSAASITSEATAGLYACATITYPILDLTGWATDETHDFESRYLESLVGPLAEHPERYRERSPAVHGDRIRAPFLLLQGLDDPICPPVQCERFLAQVAGRDVPHAYLTFAGESHGFRRAETITAAVQAELSLYAQSFGFERKDVPAVELKP